MPFICRPAIHTLSSIDGFLEALNVGADDCVLSNRWTLDVQKHGTRGAQLIWEEDFGAGEPDDGKIRRILSEMRPCKRVIGIGGGSVMDIAKIMAQETDGGDLYEMFTGQLPVRRARGLVLAPTTCGTGSEVTNVAVVAFPEKGVKLGLGDPALFADDAVLVPEFLVSLPWRPFVYAAIDALVHAVEAYLSPKADAFTRLFSEKAIRTLVHAFARIADAGQEARFELLSDMQTASCQAGLAFGNAGCGTVHAMSYPVGAQFHIAHGEVNYALFTAVLADYAKNAEPIPAFEDLCALLSELFGCGAGESVTALEALLTRVISCKRLSEYGMSRAQIAEFADLVIEKQQRLLRNSPVPMRAEDVRRIYEEAY